MCTGVDSKTQQWKKICDAGWNDALSGERGVMAHGRGMLYPWSPVLEYCKNLKLS